MNKEAYKDLDSSRCFQRGLISSESMYFYTWKNHWYIAWVAYKIEDTDKRRVSYSHYEGNISRSQKNAAFPDTDWLEIRKNWKVAEKSMARMLVDISSWLLSLYKE